MTKKFDQWDRLQAPGQHVMVPGVRPMQVSKLAKANVRRRLGPRAVVVTAYIEDVDSTFVALAYVPTDAGVVGSSALGPRTESHELSDADRKRMTAVATSRAREPEPDSREEWDEVDELDEAPDTGEDQ